MNKLFLMAVLITAVLASCKKDSTPAPICRIITVSPVSSDVGAPTYNFSYNSEGKLSSRSNSSSGSVTTYSYSGNTVIATSTNGGVFQSKKIITLNANGLASNVKAEYNETGTSWDNTLYEYSGTELIKSTQTSSAGDPADVTTYVWSGGNLTDKIGSYTVTFSYYTDKPAQTGDDFSLVQLENGYEVYRLKNAVKSYLVGSTIVSYSYSFDTDGKIASIAITTGTTTSTDDYQYQCN
jgi:hypothetical protein